MKYEFKNLNDKTREIMNKELEMDLSNNKFYEPRSMNQEGLEKYPKILKDCLLSSDPITLSKQLPRSFFNATNKIGRTTMHNINEVVACNDYNKYYVRAILQRAITEKLSAKIYRAKFSQNPSPISENLIRDGKTYTTSEEMQQLLTDFRNPDILYSNKIIKEILNPNSGLSLHLVDKFGKEVI